MYKITVSSLALLGLAWACVPQTDPIPEEEIANERGDSAKTSGSCATPKGDTCGGKAKNGSCWCDELCAQYGDCCSDVGDTCGTNECTLGDDTTCGEGQTCNAILCKKLCPPGMSQNECCGPHYCADAPAPELCLADDACGPGRVCDHSECLSGCADGMICPAVCYGQCVDAPAPTMCGGFAGFPCPAGQECVDDPADDCDPANGGADCGGICIDAPPPAANSCQGHCGGPSEDKSCYCDDLCEGYGDCCSDFAELCGS